MKLLRLALLCGLILASSLAHAVQPDEMLHDPALEARPGSLSAAPVAPDIRLLSGERISKGESNEAVRGFLVSRYGDFILLKPPFKTETLLLWIGAPLALAIGALAIWRAVRRREAA